MSQTPLTLGTAPEELPPFSFLRTLPMCKDAAAIQPTDKVNPASDAIAKCGLDFKMDYLQKPDALAQSHLSTGADKTNLPDLTIIDGGPAKAFVPQGEYQSKALPKDGTDHFGVKKYDESPKMNKQDLQLVPDAELETKIRHH
jgi:hypothetical protein